MDRAVRKLDQLDVASLVRALTASPAPVLVVGADGQLRGGSPAALHPLGLREGTTAAIRDVLGLGWRQLELVAAEGRTDLLIDLPRTRPGVPRRGWRLRPELVADVAGRVLAVVAYLDAPALEASEPSGRPAGGGVVELDAIFGHDPRVRATKAAAARFAATRLPLLLLAETGTGKDLLARAIHGASQRRDRPFVAINCGALSPHLLESELFGYAPGAFTDASREGHEGKIGAARGGTLFLDEVAEMPGPLQALLLRVLEDGTYYRVGESKPRQADVRLICATCRDLPRLVEEGGFRQDLYFRIAGACLSLPPLRERDDLPALIRHLLDSLLDREWPAGRARPRLDSAAAAWLAAQSWPGNVRQLKTALQYALVLCEDGTIRREHLPEAMFGRRERAATADGDGGAATRDRRIEAAARAEVAQGDVAGASPSAVDRAGSPASLADMELAMVRRAVEETGGNLSLAARRLGIARTTLYRHLRRVEASAGPAPRSRRARRG